MQCIQRRHSSLTPYWRSILFVPANVQKYVPKAVLSGADAIQLDLEDSVPANEKENARSLVRQTAKAIRAKGIDVLVRVNRPLSLTVRDVEAAICEDVCAITLTKVDGPSHVRLIDELMSECEYRQGMDNGHTRLVLAIETPRAFEQMSQIALASPRIAAMALGNEDFALECGCEPNEEVMRMPKQQLIIAARAAGIMPMGFLGSIANFKDIEAFRAMVRRSRQFGFDAATCIHPSQIPVVNEEYSPSEAQLQAARKIIEHDNAAEAGGRGSFQIDAQMIDAPIVERARRLLARAENLEVNKS